MYYEQLNDLSDEGGLTPSESHTPRDTRARTFSSEAFTSPRCEEISNLLPEFDRICNNYKELNADQAKVERGFLNLCELVQRQQKQWAHNTQQVKFLQNENSRISKELSHTSKKMIQYESEIEAKVEKCTELEKQIDDMQEAFDLMAEIIYDDPDMSCSRRAQMQVLQSNFKQVAQRTMSDISDTSPNTTREHSVVTASEPESELNAAYGDMYTNVTSRKRRVKEYLSSVPMPSCRAGMAPPRPPPPPATGFLNVSPIKRVSHIQDPVSFMEDQIPDREEIYDVITPPKEQYMPITKAQKILTVDGVPTELTLYVSALAGKLGHPDLYVTSPETEEVLEIEEMKKMVREMKTDEDTMLSELDKKSTNVLCQLVKDFFLDNEHKLFNAKSDLMTQLLQSVRCCNIEQLQRLLLSLTPGKQLQLAFLMRHLQSAQDAGRLPGELADAFGSVIVSAGCRNRNDPKELCEKLLSVAPKFFNDMMTSATAAYDPNEPKSDTETSMCSMLGPVKMAGGETSSSWKKMIEERRHKLLQNCDVKLFTSPKKQPQ